MKDEHSPASPNCRPVNAQELLEQNLFGPGATLGDVARHFDRSLDAELCAMTREAVHKPRSWGQRFQKPRGRSRYKGVAFHRRSGRWLARIQILGVRHNLGYFATEEQAARAYDRARYQEHLRARGNFPVEDYPEFAEALAQRRARSAKLQPGWRTPAKSTPMDQVGVSGSKPAERNRERN